MNVRHPVSVIICLGLGASVGGLQAYTIQYMYGDVPIRWVLVLAPVAGILLYVRARDLVELFTLFIATVVVTMAASVAFQSIPVLVLDDMSLLEQNVIVLTALNKSLFFTFLSGGLIAAGVAVATIAVRGIGVHRHVERSDRVITVLVAGVLLVLVGTTSGTTVGVNQASAIEQATVSATVDQIFVSEGTVVVTIGFDNRLESPMRVESVRLVVETETERNEVSAFPERSIAATSGARIVVTTTCEVLAGARTDRTVEPENNGDVTRADTVTYGGHVSVSAFNGYAERLPIERRVDDQPC